MKNSTTNGTTLTENTYAVVYGDHDQGAPSGVMFREGMDEAERSAKLMAECGYEFTDIRHAWSMFELSVPTFPTR